VASLSQGRTAAAQCGLFTYKSVPVIFEPPCISHIVFNFFSELNQYSSSSSTLTSLCECTQFLIYCPPSPFFARAWPIQPPIKWVPISFPCEYSGRGVMLTTYSLLVSRWKTSGDLPPLSLHAFMAWVGTTSPSTGWTVRRSNPGGGEIFHTRPLRPWSPAIFLHNEYRVFSGGKAAGAWRWPPSPSSAEVKERL